MSDLKEEKQSEEHSESPMKLVFWMFGFLAVVSVLYVFFLK